MKKKILILVLILTTLVFGFVKYRSSKDINVVFAIDNNYPVFTLLAINSILKHNDSHSNYKFYIVNTDLSEENQKMMKEYVHSRKQNIKFIKFDPNIVNGGDNIYKHLKAITPVASARLAFPSILPRTLKKCLYLDGDVLIREDLKTLYNIIHYHL